MFSLTDIAILLALSQLVTISLSFAFFNPGFEGRLISFLSFCLGCLVLGDFSRVADSTLFSYLLFRLGTLTPFILWYLAFRLFTDNEKLIRPVWIPVLYFVLARAIGVPLYSATLTNSTLYFMLIYVIPQLIMVSYSCLAIWRAIQGYRADLVEERRRFRVIFVISVGVFLAIRALNGFFTFADPFLDNFSLFSRTPVPPYVFPIYVFLIGLVFNLSVFRVSDRTLELLTDLAPVSRPQPSPPHEPEPGPNHKLMTRLLETVVEQRLYSQHGLTITSLAEALGVQEYRLRKLINRELNFKNFNQFLNSYRLTEASSRLAAETTSISTIALDVGFVSLSSFNTAFKTRFGMTPTEYRTRHRSD
ncbi:MAG: helix-turn-helix transcriptional regulator [Gammaproteobacteria bacterium]|nr:helix-turn-helix transcriptional regulator [Pseudomonadales bacterium]MCP5348206.1 helix-turn-helix transcriptional regulator [Pseudomonadales bacterium]